MRTLSANLFSAELHSGTNAQTCDSGGSRKTLRVISFTPIFGIIINYCLLPNKSDTMCRVAVCVKRAIWILVIYGIIYVLIMPIPELGAAFAGKTLIATLALIAYALLAFCFLLLSILSRTLDSGSFSASDVLERFCIRLC